MFLFFEKASPTGRDHFAVLEEIRVPVRSFTSLDFSQRCRPSHVSNIFYSLVFPTETIIVLREDFSKPNLMYCFFILDTGVKFATF